MRRRALRRATPTRLEPVGAATTRGDRCGDRRRQPQPPQCPARRPRCDAATGILVTHGAGRTHQIAKAAQPVPQATQQIVKATRTRRRDRSAWPRVAPVETVASRRQRRSTRRRSRRQPRPSARRRRDARRGPVRRRRKRDDRAHGHGRASAGRRHDARPPPAAPQRDGAGRRRRAAPTRRSRRVVDTTTGRRHHPCATSPARAVRAATVRTVARTRHQRHGRDCPAGGRRSLGDRRRADRDDPAPRRRHPIIAGVTGVTIPQPIAHSPAAPRRTHDPRRQPLAPGAPARPPSPSRPPRSPSGSDRGSAVRRTRPARGCSARVAVSRVVPAPAGSLGHAAAPRPLRPPRADRRAAPHSVTRRTRAAPAAPCSLGQPRHSAPRARFRAAAMAALLALFLLAVLAAATRLVTVQAFVRPAPLVLLPDPPG